MIVRFLFAMLLTISPSVAFGYTLSPSVSVLPSTTVEVGEAVYFDGESTTYDGDALVFQRARYEWDFGDGYYHRFDPVVTTVQRSGLSVMHYFMAPGTYTVTMTVTLWETWNNDGTPSGDPLDTQTDTVEITVTGEAPLSGFEIQRPPFYNRVSQYLYVQIPSAHRGGATQLKVSLIGDSEGTNVLLAPKNNLSAEEIVLLDMSSLNSDNYVVQAELLDSENTRISGGLWRDKFDWQGVPLVAINKDNSFVVGGELHFPISAFMVLKESLGSYKSQASLNTVQTYGAWEGFRGFADLTQANWGTYVSAAAAAGLQVVGPGRGEYAGQWYTTHVANRWVFNSSIDQMTGWINDVKSGSTMFAWIWDDEPNLGSRWEKIYPPTLAAWRYNTHLTDYNRPSWNLLYGYDWSPYYTVNTAWDYLGSANLFGGKKWSQDVFAFDIYELSFRRTTHPAVDNKTKGPHQMYLEALDRIKSQNKDLIPIFPTLQPCPEFNGDPEVLPEQTYMQAWMNVCNGAKGLMWFPLFVVADINWTAMKTFADQMVTYQSIILDTPPSNSVSDNSDESLNRVDTLIREKNGTTYIWATRITEPVAVTGSLFTGEEPETITTTFTCSDTGVNGEVGVLEMDDSGNHGYHTVTATNGVFQDTLPTYAVRLYTFPAQGGGSPSAAKSNIGSTGKTQISDTGTSNFN